jgi:hypothetical protein
MRGNQSTCALSRRHLSHKGTIPFATYYTDPWDGGTQSTLGMFVQPTLMGPS